MNGFTLWLIEKLGAVSFNELASAQDAAKRADNSARETRNRLYECQDQKERAESALARFIDSIKIDPDGYHRPRPMDLPFPVFDHQERLDVTCKIHTLRVTPQPIHYSVAEDFGEPEGVLLYRIATAANLLGQATSTEIKARFGIQLAEFETPTAPARK